MTMLSRNINLTQCFKLQTRYGGLLINNHHFLIHALAVVLKVLWCVTLPPPPPPPPPSTPTLVHSSLEIFHMSEIQSQRDLEMFAVLD